MVSLSIDCLYLFPGSSRSLRHSARHVPNSFREIAPTIVYSRVCSGLFGFLGNVAADVIVTREPGGQTAARMEGRIYLTTVQYRLPQLLLLFICIIYLYFLFLFVICIFYINLFFVYIDVLPFLHIRNVFVNRSESCI